MPTCKFESRAELNAKVLRGVNILADNVAATLGPKGRNVILQEKGKDPMITKDGVTVSAFVHLDDEFENAAAQILKQATSQYHGRGRYDHGHCASARNLGVCTKIYHGRLVTYRTKARHRCRRRTRGDSPPTERAPY